MAPKYQDGFGTYIYLFPKFQEYSVLAAAKTIVFFTSKGFGKGLAI